MEIRTLTFDDYGAINALISEAFAQGNQAAFAAIPETPPEGYLNTHRLGVFVKDKLVATAFTHNMSYEWISHEASLGGVAGVTCTASQRGQGLVDKLLRQSLIAMREKGQYVSGLYPFEYSFYKRYGYGWVGERRVCTLPVAELKSSPEGRTIETLIGIEAKAVVEPIYLEYAKRYRGMHLRRGIFPNWWERALVKPSFGSSDRTTYIHVYTNPQTSKPEGYFTFRYEDERERGKVGEFIALTPDAYRGLLSVLRNYGTQIKTVKIETPVDDSLPLHVMQHSLERVSKPLFMARIVDVKPSLEALKPADEISGSCVVKVIDSICDWNDGVFKIEIEAGKVSVSKSDRSPEVTLTIEQLTQAYWGTPDLEMLRSAGLIEVRSEAGFDVLKKLLPKTVNYMIDFF